MRVWRETPGARAVDEKQRRHVFDARRDQKGVGHVTVEHEMLFAVEPEARPFALRARRLRARRFLVRQRDDRLGRCDARQPFLLLRGRSAFGERGRRQHRGREKRREHEIARHLARDETCADDAKT